MASDTSRDVVDWQPGGVPEEASRPAPDRLLGGDPVHTVRNVYADPSGRFFAGVWSSTAGRWRVAYTEHEFCRITRGRIRIESDTGRVCTYSAGDSFVIPAGFRGIWEVIETAEKQYVIYEPPAP